MEVSRAWVDDRLKHTAWVAAARQRLQSLGWFIKSLKVPLARMANREEENVRGVLRGAIQECRHP